MSFLADLRLGDCVFVMGELKPDSIDAIVCDPPYGLEFMGKKWDRLDGGFSKPGIGERQTPWSSYGGDPFAGYNPSCATCGGRLRGKKKCECEEPDWRIKGQDIRQPGDETFHKSGSGPHDRSTVRYGYGVPGRLMQEWHESWAREALRVLKPGGHLVAFGGTRTYHRLACALEDAGFEIRDCLAWMYGSGFPKSLDVAKAIDNALGVERTEVAGVKPGHEEFVARTDAHSAGGRSEGWERPWRDDPDAVARSHLAFAPATEDARRWQGWGTALKPGYEPIALARKPLVGTVAANVLEHGTGALNVDVCRIDFRDERDEAESKDKNRHADFESGPRENRVYGTDERARGEHGNYDAPGRWPANVALDEEAAAMLDEQTGELAARFFYCAKTSRAERNAGLAEFQSEGTEKEERNFHPTVKPIDLMRWLCRLVTPPAGLILDPFMGSGTTAIAAGLEGFTFIGIERQADYLEIARARIAFWAEHGEDALTKMQTAESGKRRRDELEEAGQATFEWAPE